MSRTILVRLSLGLGLAGVLLILLTPPVPAVRVGPVAAVASGALTGLGLYLAVSRRRPYVPPPVPAALAACAILVVAAASEEVVWRRIVLGELLAVGPLAALAGSSLGFALVHRARQAVHLGTGAAFGGLYLATGALAASIVAHWSYNVLLLTLAEQRRTREAAR
jgi:membrane protease YdiL (CAAX protease family)